MSEQESKHPEAIPWRLFWRLWFQKNLRNISSMKYQWLVFLYIPVVWGMFHIPEDSITGDPWISATVGVSGLFGGFVTLALGRIYARTKLTENNYDGLNTENLKIRNNRHYKTPDSDWNHDKNLISDPEAVSPGSIAKEVGRQII